MHFGRARAQGFAALLVVGSLALAGCGATKIRMHLRNGNQLYNAQKYEEAAAEYESILAIDPEHWQANYLAAISYMAMFHPGSDHAKDREFAAKAIAAFETTLALPAPDEESEDKVRAYYLGLLTLTNRADKAIAYIEELRRTKPDDLDLMSQLGGLYVNRGEYEKAAVLYETRANKNPDDKVAWYSLGVLRWKQVHDGASQLAMPDRETAIARGIEAFERALALDPKYFDALSYINLIYREKATYLGEMNQYDEAQLAIAKADEYRAQAMALKAQTPAAGAAPAGS